MRGRVGTNLYIFTDSGLNMALIMDQTTFWQKFWLLAVVVLGWGTGPLNAQFLNWDYYNILDEERESGARPDMALDAAGRLHIVYWHSSEDRVIYLQEQASGGWIREYIQPQNSNGPTIGPWMTSRPSTAGDTVATAPAPPR